MFKVITLPRRRSAQGVQQVGVFGQESEDMLNQEIMRCEALLESESDRSKCKWPILTLARLLELRAMLTSQESGSGEIIAL